jgi:hypothetical protein
VHGVLVHGGVPRCRGVSLTFPQTAQCPIDFDELKLTLEKKFGIEVVLGTHGYQERYCGVWYRSRRVVSWYSRSSPLTTRPYSLYANALPPVKSQSTMPLPSASAWCPAIHPANQ